MITLHNFNQFNFYPLLSSASFQTKRQRYYKLSSPQFFLFSKRFMLNSRSFHAIRAAYNLALTISNHSDFEKNKTQPFISQAVRNSIDDAQGIPQHKAALLKHLTHQRLPAEYFYEYFKDISANGDLIKYEPHALTDFRITNEFAVLQEYLKTYGHDIAWVYATIDARAATFPKAQQSNPDFWVYLNKALGLKEPRCTYQDEKSGMDMMRHSSRGSIGVLYYDENGTNIQMTQNPITVQDLIRYNNSRVQDISNALRHDGLYDTFEKTILQAKTKASEIKGNASFQDFALLHKDLQDLLWTKLQCNPNYNRSISFVFLKQIINTPMTDNEYLFSQAFQSKLKPGHLYNLDKKGDLKELYTALIYAGKRIDTHFVDKLYNMHHNGVTLTNDIMLILKEVTKHAL
jgi:hypothetical protein